MLALLLLAAPPLTAAATVATHPGTVTGPGMEITPVRSFVSGPVTAPGRYRGLTAEEWAARFRQRTQQVQTLRAHLRERWRPTVRYALELAAAVTGVSLWQLSKVSWCESRHFPFAENGRYKGLFQLGWEPFDGRFSAFDPIANAIDAAMTVRHDGSWRQWECQP